MKEIRAFKGTSSEAKLFCNGITPDNLLAFGVSTDGTRFHVLYLCGRDDGEEKSVFTDRVPALLDGEMYGYVSKWSKVLSSSGEWISMVSLDARVSGARLDSTRSIAAEILNAMGDRSHEPYDLMPVGFGLVCPADTVFKTSGVSHQELNTDNVCLLPGGHVVYTWNVRTKTPGAQETADGTVFATSLRFGVYAAYRVKDFKGRQIMGMSPKKVHGGSAVIHVEFSDLGNAILFLEVRDVVSLKDCQMVQTAPATKKTRNSTPTVAFAS